MADSSISSPHRIAALIVALVGAALALLPSPARGDAPPMSDACALHCAGLAPSAVQEQEAEPSHCGSDGETTLLISDPSQPQTSGSGKAVSCHALALQIESACANGCQLDGMPAHPAGAAPEGLPPSPSPTPRADRTRPAATYPRISAGIRAPLVSDPVQSGFFRVPDPPPRS